MSLLLNSTINLILPLVLAGVFVLAIIAGMIWGTIRGLKKQTFRLGWIVVTAVVLFFLTPVITRGLMNINLGFLNINISGVKLTTISAFVTELLSQIPDYGVIFADNPEVINSVLQVITIFFNAFVYVLLFWLVKMVLWPVWAILSATLIKNKKKDGTKKVKHRLFGMLVGAISGIIVGATTLMPVMGIIGIANKIEYETAYPTGEGSSQIVASNGGTIERTGVITSLLGEDVASVLKAYNTSFTAGLFKYTTVEFFNNAIYGGLSTATVNNQKVVLKDEISAVLNTIDSIKTLSNCEFKDYTQEKLNKIISALRYFTDDVFKIKTLSAIGDKLLPYVVDQMITNPDFVIKLPSTDSKILDYVLNESLAEINGIKFSDIKNELICVTNIAQILNNKNVLAPILNNNASLNSVLDLLDTDSINQVTNQIFAMRTIGSAMPIVINAGYLFVADYFEINDFEIEDEHSTVEEVKTLINAVLNIGFEAYNSLDLDSKYYVTKPTFASVGKVLDAIKQYKGVSQQNFNKIIVELENRIYNSLNSMLASTNDRFDLIKAECLNVVTNFSTVTNFEAELTKVGNVFENIKIILDSLQQDPDNIELEHFGIVLDSVKETKLFGPSVKPIVKAIIKTVARELPVDFVDMRPILDRIADNVTNINSWQTEFKSYSNLYKVIIKMQNDQNLGGSVLEEDNTYLSEFGESLNSLKQSTLFGHEIKNIVKVIVDYAETLLQGANNIALNAFDQIKTNLQLVEGDVNWKVEFEALQQLAIAANEFNDVSITVEHVGNRFDTIVLKNSKLINRDVLNSVIISVIDDFSKNVNDADVEPIIEKMKNILKTNESIKYKQELAALETLIDEMENIDIDNFDYARFGRMLDEFDESSNVRPSKVVSSIRTDIVKMIIGKVDTSDFPQDLVDIINKITNNVDSITSYQNEFIHLEKFVNKCEQLKSLDVEAFDMVSFGELLDDFDDSKLLANVRGDVVVMVLSRAEDNTTDVELKDMVVTMKLQVPNIVSYRNEFYALQNFIDWRDDFTNSTIDNVSTFGRKLDEFEISVMLKAVRPKLFNKLLNQANLKETGMNNEIVLAIDDIIIQTKVCGQMAEEKQLATDGTVMTYERIFTEFGSLADIIDVLKEVNITQDNYNLQPFGSSLDQLTQLDVVPLKATVRINRFVLTEIRTITDNWYNVVVGLGVTSAELEASHAELNNALTIEINNCTAYLTESVATYNKTFVTIYAQIEQLIKNVVDDIADLVI